MKRFKVELEIIGINPFVFVPRRVLSGLFTDAGKSKGPIPIRGTVNGRPYQQTLVRYKGHWRLYVNLSMLDDSPRRIGETITVTVGFDPSSRAIAPPPQLVDALNENVEAQRAFESLPASLKKEIVRYISRLKTEESVERNVKRAIGFLLGKERFAGRERPTQYGTRELRPGR